MNNAFVSIPLFYRILQNAVATTPVFHKELVLGNYRPGEPA